MNQVPHQIWNAILRTTPVATRWAEKLFSLNGEQLEAELEKQAGKMAAAGYDNKVIVAYQDILPIYLERVAITKYISRTEQHLLRQALPEVTSISEAVYLMFREHRLTKQQADTLTMLLRKCSADSELDETKDSKRSYPGIDALGKVIDENEEMRDLLLGAVEDVESVQEQKKLGQETDR